MNFMVTEVNEYNLVDSIGLDSRECFEFGKIRKMRSIEREERKVLSDGDCAKELIQYLSGAARNEHGCDREMHTYALQYSYALTPSNRTA